MWLLMREGGDELRLEATNGHGIQPTSALIRELQDAEFIAGLRFIARGNGANGANGD